MRDVAEFLRTYEPFRGLEEADIERLAECAKVESFTAGTIIFGQGGPPPDAIRLIRGRGGDDAVGRSAAEASACAPPPKWPAT